jgi:hypothetical protein
MGVDIETRYTPVVANGYGECDFRDPSSNNIVIENYRHIYASEFVNNISIVKCRTQYIFFNAYSIKSMVFDKIEENWYSVFPHAIVSIGNKKYIINNKGENIFPIIYDKIYNWGDCFNVVLNGKEGIIDKFGNFIVDFKYDCVFGFWDNKILVRLNEKVGLVTTKDEVVIPIIYDELYFYTADVLPARIDDKWCVFNSKGKIVVPIYYDDVSVFDADDYLTVNLRGKWGCIDKNGDVVIPIIYEYPISFVESYEPTEYARACLNTKSGVIDRNGVAIIPFIYDFIVTHHVEVFIVSLNGKCGVVNQKGEIIIPIINDIMSGIGDLMLYEVGFRVSLNGKYGLANKKGKFTTSAIYDSIYHIGKDLFRVQFDKKWGIININGEIILPIVYDFLQVSDTIEEDSHILIAEINEKKGLITQRGKILTNLIYDSITVFAEGLFYTLKDGKYGITDTEGNVLDSEGYIYPRTLLKDFCKSNMCKEFLERMNKKSSDIAEKRQSFYRLKFYKKTEKETYKYALIDNLGNIVLYPEYDDISEVEENSGCFVLFIEKPIDIIDVKGNSVLLSR